MLKQWLIIIINKSLNNLSSNQEPFNCIIHNYQSALEFTNNKFNLTYEKSDKKSKKAQKKKNIYFNSPFSMTVATKIGNEFLNLVNKHFDANHPYQNFFTGRNTQYIFYNCMENLKTMIL